MAIFGNLSDRFWGFVTPGKTQRRRSKPFKTPAIPPAGRKAEPGVWRKKSMTPGARVRSWNLDSPDSKIRTPMIDMPPTPKSNDLDLDSSPVAPVAWDGSTYIGETTEGGMNANDQTVDESGYSLQATKYFSAVQERKRQWEEAKDMRLIGWSDDAIALFQKIGRRGYEPLMPRIWALDFPTMPRGLFSENDGEVFLKSVSGRNFRAAKALRSLIDIGSRVRDAVQTRSSTRSSEFHLKKAVTEYARWAFDDGQVARADAAILQILAGSSDMPAAELEQRMLDKLLPLANAYRNALRVEPSVESGGQEQGGIAQLSSRVDFPLRNDDDDAAAASGSNLESEDPPSSEGAEEDAEYWHELPTLYGMVISHTILAIVAYDITPFAPSLRHVATFDFGDAGYDVWNSLGVALAVVHVRNRMMELKPVMAMVAGSSSGNSKSSSEYDEDDADTDGDELNNDIHDDHDAKQKLVRKTKSP